MPFGVFNPGKRFLSPGNWIKDEESKAIRGVLAENAKRGRRTGALKIIDAWLRQNHLRCSACKRNAHEPHSPVCVGWRGTESVENRGAVGVQSGKDDRLIAVDKEIGSRLIDGLLEEMENTIAIGGEDHGFSVRRPGIRIISPFTEAERPQRAQVAAGLLDLGNIHDRGFSPSEENQMFAVGGNTGAHFAVGTAGEADGLAPSLIAMRVDFDGPKIGVVLVGREFTEGINQASIASPCKSASETVRGEKGTALAADEIIDAERNFDFVPAGGVHNLHEGDAMPVRRPHDRLIVGPWLGEDPARLPAIGLHLPDFLVAEVAANKNNLGAVGRDGSEFGRIHE